MTLAELAAKRWSLESVWWAMQQSDDESREAAIVSFWLDESGTDDLAPTAVVGGLLLSKSYFIRFNDAWAAILEKHSIAPPLHMKDFRRPNGRLADIKNQQRRALFTDVVSVINEHKI